MPAEKFLIGLKTENFVILASHQSNIDFKDVTLSTYSDKSIQLDKNWRTFMKVVGDADDAYFYAKYIQKEALTLDKHYLRTITPPKLHQFIKDKIKFMLDHGDYWQCDALIGGIDMVLKKPFLGFIDYRGYSITEKPFIVRNLPGLDAEIHLNSIYDSNMTLKSAIDAIQTCLIKTSQNCGYELPMFSLLIIDKNGARQHEEYL